MLKTPRQLIFVCVFSAWLRPRAGTDKFVSPPERAMRKTFHVKQQSTKQWPKTNYQQFISHFNGSSWQSDSMLWIINCWLNRIMYLCYEINEEPLIKRRAQTCRMEINVNLIEILLFASFAWDCWIWAVMFNKLHRLCLWMLNQKEKNQQPLNPLNNVLKLTLDGVREMWLLEYFSFIQKLWASNRLHFFVHHFFAALWLLAFVEHDLWVFYCPVPIELHHYRAINCGSHTLLTWVDFVSGFSLRYKMVCLIMLTAVSSCASVVLKIKTKSHRISLDANDWSDYAKDRNKIRMTKLFRFSFLCSLQSHQRHPHIFKLFILLHTNATCNICCFEHWCVQYTTIW